MLLLLFVSVVVVVFGSVFVFCVFLETSFFVSPDEGQKSATYFYMASVKSRMGQESKDPSVVRNTVQSMH